LESVDIKTAAFVDLFKDFPEHLDEIKEYHLLNGGISRQRKFCHIYKNILKKPLSEKKINELCRKFRKLVIDKVVAADFVGGAQEFLQKNAGHFEMFVASGTPQEEIEEVVQSKGLIKYFAGVYGSPKTKDKIVSDIMKKDRFKQEEVLFVGDSITDLNAAKETGVHFVARVSVETFFWLKDPAVFAVIPTLSRLDAVLEDLNKEDILARE